MPDGVKYLIGQQNRLKALLSQVPHRGPQGGMEELGMHIGALASVHVTIEKELVYPLLVEIEPDEAHRFHDEIHEALATVNASPPGDPEMFAALQQLGDTLLPHFAEAEARVYPALESLGAERMEELGHQIYARQQELLKEHPDYVSPAAAIVQPVL
ncbi:MAG: hemerythrin domain-containing protein [Acidimicrobiales bacterium]